MTNCVICGIEGNWNNEIADKKYTPYGLGRATCDECYKAYSDGDAEYLYTMIVKKLTGEKYKKG